MFIKLKINQTSGSKFTSLINSLKNDIESKIIQLDQDLSYNIKL